MEKLPENTRAEKICLEWAEDFHQKKSPSDVGYWRSIALGFRNGTEINEDALAELKMQVSMRSEVSKNLAVSLKELGEDAISKRMQKSLLEVFEEAEFMKKILG